MTLVTYSKVGPFVDNGAPGIDHNFLNALETFCAAGWFDSSITSNGSGVLTTLGLILNGPLRLQNPTTQTISNGSTITIPGPLVRVTTSGGSNVTGIILTAGSNAGQFFLLYNQSNPGNLTFASSGSNVRGGSSITVVNGNLAVMLWDGSQWINNM